MFEKVVVIDARGHLLGRLASYVAKQLLSGILIIIQDKELLLLDVKESTLLVLFSETKLNSQNFWQKDY
jgi:large subunit ribosomal protein L13Ae